MSKFKAGDWVVTVLHTDSRLKSGMYGVVMQSTSKCPWVHFEGQHRGGSGDGHCRNSCYAIYETEIELAKDITHDATNVSSKAGVSLSTITSPCYENVSIDPHPAGYVAVDEVADTSEGIFKVLHEEMVSHWAKYDRYYTDPLNVSYRGKLWPLSPPIYPNIEMQELKKASNKPTKEKKKMSETAKMYRLLKDTPTFTEGALFRQDCDGDLVPIADYWNTPGTEAMEKAGDSPVFDRRIVENSPEWFERAYEISRLGKMIYVTKEMAVKEAAKLFKSK